MSRDYDDIEERRREASRRSGSRYNESDARGGRYSEWDDRGSRYSEWDDRGSRYSERNARGSRYSERDTRGSRYSDRDARGSRYSERNARGSRYSERDARDSRYNDRYDLGSSTMQKRNRNAERRKKEKIRKIKTLFMLASILIILITTTVILYKFKAGTMFLEETWYQINGGAGTDQIDGDGNTLEYGINEALTAYSDFAPGFNLNIKPERIPAKGNQQKYIAIHYLGVNGENNSLETNGEGAHFYIYWDGTIYQAAGLDAITWHVGTGGVYTQIHPEAGNDNSIGIEMCAKCDGDATDDKDPNWYFTEETQESCALLTAYLMKIMNIDEEHVIRHGDIVDKWCPAPYFNNNEYQTSWTWDEFKSKLHTVYQKTDVTFPVKWESEVE